MRFLLDTCTFLWWINNETQLIGKKAIQVIEDPKHTLYLSAASGWEIAIKHQTGKLKLKKSPEILIPHEIHQNQITILLIHLSHALETCCLPNHHRDPFDRLIIVQSQIEKLPILTPDQFIQQYSVKTIWN